LPFLPVVKTGDTETVLAAHPELFQPSREGLYPTIVHVPRARPQILGTPMRQTLDLLVAAGALGRILHFLYRFMQISPLKPPLQMRFQVRPAMAGPQNDVNLRSDSTDEHV
jgi:hypothetical protein